MTQSMIEQVEHVAGLFPSSVSADSLSLAAELENFVTETEETYISQRLQMLHKLLFTETEKNLTNKIDFDSALESWSTRKNRKLKIRFKQ